MMRTTNHSDGGEFDLLAAFSIAFGVISTLAALSLFGAPAALVLSVFGFVTGVSARRVCLTGVALSVFAFFAGAAVIAAAAFLAFRS
jgi:hypothetical protein